MADDSIEPLEIEKLGKQKTSTPRSQEKKQTGKAKDGTKTKQQNKENQLDDEKKDKENKNLKKKTKDDTKKKEESKEGKTKKDSNDVKDEKKRKASKDEDVKDKTRNEDDVKRKSNKENKTDKNNEEEEESEEEETEMTKEEKEDMYEAVRNGDYMVLNNCLDKKNADINMTWYKENLLMAAIRSGQTNMAEFLIDVGIDYNFKAKYFNLKQKDKKGKRVDCYEKSCRDLAFDLGNDHIVECIDVKNNNVFPFVPITHRTIWQRRPPAPPLPKHLRPNNEDESSDEEEEESDCENSNTEELDSGHQSARSNEKTTETFSEMLERLGKDEGYGTLSPSGSPYLVHTVQAPPERPRLLYRPTKASMAVQTHNDQFYRRRRPSKSAPSMRYIDTIGSYAREKRQWEHRYGNNYEKDNNSIQSLPFSRSYPSSASVSSRRSSTMSSPLVEVTKILGQSRLLSARSEKSSPMYSTQRSKTVIPSLKINQWCHSNTNNVFDRLSKTNINKNNRGSNFSVNREIIRHYRK